MATDPARLRAELTITGRVQGVGFRAGTLHTAIELGLDGYVRNRPDGTVEAVFEGNPTDVRRAVSWCRGGGPMGARVDDVRVHWEESPAAAEQGFHVRY